jgi:type I restriction enzyme S subunit
MAFEIPIAPTNEQRRIVAKIEELFSELDKGIENLKQARAQLAVYGQALLKHAFEGKLTANWRAAHKDQLGSADQLLAHIHNERETRYQIQLNEWNAADGEKGSKPSKPRKPIVLPTITADERSELPVLPAAWTWIRLGSGNVDVFDGPFGSNLKTSDYVGGGVRVVRLENIGVLQFVEERESFISEEKYRGLSEHTVFPGDIVFSSFVTERTRVAIVPLSIEKAVNKSDCFCVRCHGSTLLNRYACMFLATRFAYKQLETVIHGVGRPRVNTTQLRELFMPVCSDEEQRVMIERVDEQYSEIDSLEADIDANLQKAEALRQAILKKAFAGELVPQDPADEPAAALLARIRADRANRAAAPKPGALRVRKNAAQRGEPGS